MVFSSNNILDVNDSNKHKSPSFLNVFRKDLHGYLDLTCLLGTCSTMYNECFVWNILRFRQQMGLHPLQVIIMVHGLLLSKIVIDLTHDYAWLWTLLHHFLNNLSHHFAWFVVKLGSHYYVPNLAFHDLWLILNFVIMWSMLWILSIKSNTLCLWMVEGSPNPISCGVTKLVNKGVGLIIAPFFNSVFGVVVFGCEYNIFNWCAFWGYNYLKYFWPLWILQML